MALEHQQDPPTRRRRESDVLAGSRTLLLGVWRQVSSVPLRTPTEEPELFAALESEIIPRLMLASSTEEVYPRLVRTLPEGARPAFTTRDKDAFIAALLSEDAAHTGTLADAHLANGHDVATVLIELFAWAARELGELWTDDRVSFVDVTIGLCRLHEALHRYSDRTDPPSEIVFAPSIFIAIAPGEQHLFGMLMAAELFRQDGWDVTTETSGDPETIIHAVGSRRFDLAGLSVSQDGVTAGLAPLVASIRKASKNPSVKLVVGGQLFEHSPQVAHEIGADAIAGRGPDAPELARKLLAI